MSIKTETRRKAIISYLQDKKQANIKELSAHFNVTTETIRKDLFALEQRDSIQKHHGWAQFIDKYNELPIDVKMEENIELKQRIALQAVELINDNSLIYLDPGSTTLAMTKYLPLKKDLTIVTCSLPIAQRLLSTKHETILLGGKLQKKGSTAVGAFTLENLEHVKIDMAFMGTDGFYQCDGPTTFSYEELIIKQKVLEKATKKYLLCDVTKFSKTGTYPFGKFAQYDCIITNNITLEERKQIEEAKEILCV